MDIKPNEIETSAFNHTFPKYQHSKLPYCVSGSGLQK